MFWSQSLYRGSPDPRWARGGGQPKLDSKWAKQSAVARGGFSRGWVWDLAENRSVSGSGRPRGALKPSREVGGEAPTPLDGFKAPRCRPGPENDRFSAKSKNPSAKPPSGNRREDRSILTPPHPPDFNIDVKARCKETSQGTHLQHHLTALMHTPAPQARGVEWCIILSSAALRLHRPCLSTAGVCMRAVRWCRGCVP